MATQAQIQLLLSLAGGAATHGYQQASFGQSCQPSLQSSNYQSVRYELYEYPIGFAVPAGWTQDPTTNIYYFAPNNPTILPTAFNLPASGGNTWGWFMFRVRANGNPLVRNADLSPNTSYSPLLTDEATAIVIPSPTTGALGVAYNLFNQYTPDPLRLGGVGPMMQSLRAHDAAIASSGGSTAGWVRITAATTLTGTQTLVDGDTSGGAFTITMPPTAQLQDGVKFTIADVGSNWATNNLTVAPNAGQALENPASQGNYPASVVLNIKGGTVIWQWNARLSRWKVA